MVVIYLVFAYFTVCIFCAVCGISTSNRIENVVVGSPCSMWFINTDSSVISIHKYKCHKYKYYSVLCGEWWTLSWDRHISDWHGYSYHVSLQVITVRFLSVSHCFSHNGHKHISVKFRQALTIVRCGLLSGVLKYFLVHFRLGFEEISQWECFYLNDWGMVLAFLCPQVIFTAILGVEN